MKNLKKTLLLGLLVGIVITRWGLSGDYVASGVVTNTWIESRLFGVHYFAGLSQNGNVNVVELDKNTFGGMAVGRTCVVHYDNFNMTTAYSCKE